MKDNLLEIDDVLFYYNRWHGLEKFIIDKTTPKQAVSGSLKFYREVEESNAFGRKKLNVRRIGEYGYADLSTPELESEYTLQNIRKKAARLISNTRTENLSKEQCDNIITALSQNTAT